MNHDLDNPSHEGGEFLRDATGALGLSNEAGEVTAEELHRAILWAQQMLLSEVLDGADVRTKLKPSEVNLQPLRKCRMTKCPMTKE